VSFEVENQLIDSAFFPIADWAIETGVWNGRKVSIEDTPLVFQDIQERIQTLLFSHDPNSNEFCKAIAYYARIGSKDTERALIEKEIHEFKLLQDGRIIEVGFGKSVKTFWKKHQTAIWIGIGAVALVTTVVIVAVCTGGTAAAPIAAAGSAGLAPTGKRRKEDSEEEKTPLSSAAEPPKDPLKKISPPSIESPQISSSWLHLFSSCPFEIEGKQYTDRRIGFINGMNCSFEDAKANAKHIQKFTSNESIEGVYNKSHGIRKDMLEAAVFNYQGISFNTDKLLVTNLERFHEENASNPKAKYLLFCHSKGAIEVRNALVKLSEEVRNRAIIVAIAPAAVVPRELCYQSHNYASKRDPIPYGEAFVSGWFDSNETGISKRSEQALENHEQLILLDPHPDAEMVDHSFMSPTFHQAISDHIKEYNACNGEYK